MEGFFKDIVKGQVEITKQDPGNYLWHSFWFLIRRSDRVAVGSADFKTVPDENGQVEIGYGLGKAFEKNGYMTEAVKAMCDWAMEQKGVSCVTAETNLDGFASQRILKRCGFAEEKRDKTIWWCLSFYVPRHHQIVLSCPPEMGTRLSSGSGFKKSRINPFV